jgi:hypothetical protein
MNWIDQATVFNYPFLMVDSSDHLAGKEGLTVTVTISKNGAAFASAAGSVTELVSGWYSIALSAADTGTLGMLALHASASGADPTDMMVGRVIEVAPGDLIDTTVEAVSAQVWADGPELATVADIWDEDLSSHTTAGTTGKSVSDLLQIGTGKWRIDKAEGTLVLYESDDTTPLYSFTLTDDGTQAMRTPL